SLVLVRCFVVVAEIVLLRAARKMLPCIVRGGRTRDRRRRDEDDHASQETSHRALLRTPAPPTQRFLFVPQIASGRSISSDPVSCQDAPSQWTALPSSSEPQWSAHASVGVSAQTASINPTVKTNGELVHETPFQCMML